MCTHSGVSAKSFIGAPPGEGGGSGGKVGSFGLKIHVTSCASKTPMRQYSSKK